MPPGRVTRAISATARSGRGRKFSTGPLTTAATTASATGRAVPSPTTRCARRSVRRRRASRTYPSDASIPATRSERRDPVPPASPPPFRSRGRTSAGPEERPATARTPRPPAGSTARHTARTPPVGPHLTAHGAHGPPRLKAEAAGQADRAPVRPQEAGHPQVVGLGRRWSPQVRHRVPGVPVTQVAGVVHVKGPPGRSTCAGRSTRRHPNACVDHQPKRTRFLIQPSNSERKRLRNWVGGFTVTSPTDHTAVKPRGGSAP